MDNPTAEPAPYRLILLLYTVTAHSHATPVEGVALHFSGCMGTIGLVGSFVLTIDTV